MTDDLPMHYPDESSPTPTGARQPHRHKFKIGRLPLATCLYCPKHASQFKRAAQLGVTKVNIDTDGRLVWTRVHREYFLEHPENFDMRPPGKVFMAEYAKFIADKNEKLGSAGQLEKVRQLLLVSK